MDVYGKMEAMAVLCVQPFWQPYIASHKGMAKHPLVCLSMLCCALAYFGGSLLPPVSVTADTLEAAADDCNQLTSVVHQGFVIEETSAPDLFVCRSCATLNFAVGGI
jgi:hypothetical protein